MATSFAPRRFASCARVQKWRLETIGLLPQIRIRRLRSNSSTSVPMAAPIVATQPALPAVAQIVRSSSDAPSRWKKRRSIEPYCRSPIVPAYEYGTMASGPSGDAAIAANLSAIVASASSHEIRSKRPSPFRPTRFIGWSTRSSE